MTDPLPTEEKRRRTPRRVVAGTGEKAAPVHRPRKTAVGKESPVRRVSRSAATPPVRVEAPAPERIVPDSIRRKAPTPLAGEQARQRDRKRKLIVISVLLLFGVGASAAVGLTDKGQIDVNQTIEDRNERVRTHTTDERDVSTSLVEVPVQNTNAKENAQKADGGLVGLGSVSKPAPAPVVVQSTSTTDQTATSTATTASSTADFETDTSNAEENSPNGTPADDESNEAPPL